MKEPHFVPSLGNEEAHREAQVYASQPVKRELAESPEDWRWSSYRFYRMNEAGLVRVNEGWAKISFADRAAA